MAAAAAAAKDKDKKKKNIFQKDPRIMPCIVDFLECKMRTYAMDHHWKFDETDFAPLREAFQDPGKEKKVQTSIIEV